MKTFVIALQNFRADDYQPEGLEDAYPTKDHEQRSLAGQSMTDGQYTTNQLVQVTNGMAKTKRDFRVYVAEVEKSFKVRFPTEQRGALRSLNALNFRNWPYEDPGTLQEFEYDAIGTVASFIIPVSNDALSELKTEAIFEWVTFRTQFAQFVGRDFASNAQPLDIWHRILSGKDTSKVSFLSGCPIIGSNLARVIECAIILPMSSAENERLARGLSFIDTETS